MIDQKFIENSELNLHESDYEHLAEFIFNTLISPIKLLVSTWVENLTFTKKPPTPPKKKKRGEKRGDYNVSEYRGVPDYTVFRETSVLL